LQPDLRKSPNSLKSNDLSPLDASGCDQELSLPIDFYFANSAFSTAILAGLPNPNF
jgi:hypothetical protein